MGLSRRHTTGPGHLAGRAAVAVFAATALFATLLRAAEPVSARRQMVVAANPHAAEAGLRILRDGGNAVDAAIAVQLVLSLVEPQSSGIGGGAFMLYFDAPDSDGEAPEIVAYSGRETAPAAATPDMFLDEDGDARSFADVGFGGLSVGVPGVMRMLEMAHREHGRLPWPDLFVPAIELAEHGFDISPRLYFLLDRFEGAARAEAFRAHYFDAGGKARRVGERLVNEEYAATLRLLAAEGADAMYEGELAARIVDIVRNNALEPGRLSLEDMAGYRALRSSPLCSDYRQWRVCGPRPPSSGGVTVQQILGMLEAFDLAAGGADAARSIHLIVEASRLAFADRNLYLGDPDFIDVPVAGLLSDAYLRSRAALIDPAAAMTEVEPGKPEQLTGWDYSAQPLSDLSSTSHFSITDQWGDAVSMTTSVQGAFGSQLMVGGFILNNQLTDFSMRPSSGGRPVANRADSGKRPLSSMAPTLVLDGQGRLKMLIGSPGGTRIINYVTQTIVAVLDWGENIQDAVAAPHFVSRGGPVELESGTQLLELGPALEALGHQVVPRGLNSGLHAIVIEYRDDGRVLFGGVDPRREGAALGD